MNVLKKLNLASDEVPCKKPQEESQESVGRTQEEVANKPPDLVSLQKNAKGPIEGLLVFYVNVGQMPSCNVEKYLQRTMESYKKVIERIPEKYAALWVPCRTRETTIEIVSF